MQGSLSVGELRIWKNIERNWFDVDKKKKDDAVNLVFTKLSAISNCSVAVEMVVGKKQKECR